MIFAEYLKRLFCKIWRAFGGRHDLAEAAGEEKPEERTVGQQALSRVLALVGSHFRVREHVGRRLRIELGFVGCCLGYIEKRFRPAPADRLDAFTGQLVPLGRGCSQDLGQQLSAERNPSEWPP